MKIIRLDFSHLQNAEHFQFHADVLALLNEIDAATVKYEAQIDAYKAAFDREDEMMKKIVESEITRRIADADAARDKVFRGMVTYHKSTEGHFLDAMRQAAAKTRPVFKIYKNMNTESLARQSANTYNFIQELRTNYPEECETLGLEPWLDELDRNNKIVETLMRQRDAESTQRRPVAAMKEVRRSVDEAWRPLTMCIEVFAMTETGNTAAALAAIIARLNTITERYKNAMAIRRGRAAAKKEGAAAEQQLIEN